jgi:hypothetical protein
MKKSPSAIPGAADKINKLHDEFCASMRSTLQIAIDIGELLVEQKKQCGHGKWLPWVKANLRFSEATAKRYMQCYSNRDALRNRSPMSDLDITGALEIIATKARAKKTPRLKAPAATTPEITTEELKPPPPPQLEAPKLDDDSAAAAAAADEINRLHREIVAAETQMRLRFLALLDFIAVLSPEGMRWEDLSLEDAKRVCKKLDKVHEVLAEAEDCVVESQKEHPQYE